MTAAPHLVGGASGVHGQEADVTVVRAAPWSDSLTVPVTWNTPLVLDTGKARDSWLLHDVSSIAFSFGGDIVWANTFTGRQALRLGDFVVELRGDKLVGATWLPRGLSPGGLPILVDIPAPFSHLAMIDANAATTTVTRTVPETATVKIGTETYRLGDLTSIAFTWGDPS